MSQLLIDSEQLEERAASDRVAFYSDYVDSRGQPPAVTLDVGCGNGYSVKEWNSLGVAAFGIDVSLYRLSRWQQIHRGRKPLAVADASALPFPDGVFDLAVSSGMIEHVGITESSNPYRIRPHADKSAKREAVLSELLRVVKPGKHAILDFPNGSFPVDFWHGDRLGTFRVHGVPDSLLPSHREIRRWAQRAGGTANTMPLSGRLRFRQVGSRWWGRAFSPLMRLFILVLDTAVRFGLGPVVSCFYPYLVIQLTVGDDSA